MVTVHKVITLTSGGRNNQEDSLIVNKTSVQRGLARAVVLKNYSDSITKNSSTAQNDIFKKPESGREVVGIKAGNYGKLTDKGYVPEETVVESGDMIIGKVSPIQPSSKDAKSFKDESTMFKSNVPAVVDRVYHDIKNADGYEHMIVMLRMERTPTIGDKFACYDPETEVLTTFGWKRIGDITMDDQVATLQDGERLEYHHPLALQSYDHDGRMYRVDSNQVDLLVTENHRMWVRPRVGSGYRVERADAIYGARRHYKKNVDEWRPPRCDQWFAYDEEGKLTHFKLPGITGVASSSDISAERLVPIEPWLIFFGIWIAEGCVSKGTGVNIAAHKQRVKEALDMIHDELGIEVRTNKSGNAAVEGERNSWRYSDKHVLDYLRPLSVGAVNKSLPEWAWALPKELCRTLIHGMCLGDGHTMSNGTRRYYTSSSKLADDLQRLCLHAGWATNKTLRYEAGHSTVVMAPGREGEVITSRHDAYHLTIIETQVEPLVNKNIKRDGADRSDGWVDYRGKVYCCTVPGTGIIYVRRNGMSVWCGNSVHAQKGTVGLLLDDSDMPFSESGIQPDIIVNSSAIPSRMTIGQLMECVVSKNAALKGEFFDATPFNDLNIDKVYEELKRFGFNEHGYETLSCGFTGKRIQTKIFIGPTFYMRLKHMTNDKYHSRSNGPNQNLTRQPLEGRSRDGGLRFGEMERDCMIAHQCSQFLKERMLDASDFYSTYVCNNCGMFATKKKDRATKDGEDNNTWYCVACQNAQATSRSRDLTRVPTNVSRVVMPYAFKLMVQEIMSINILPRIRTKAD